jgi:hypothetical protein
MRGAFKLPKFTVVVWVRKTDDYPTIRDELLGLAADDPYESTEYEGMVDFHWGFDHASQANELANSFRDVAKRPEIVVLRITGDDANSSLTFKDERHVRH